MVVTLEEPQLANNKHLEGGVRLPELIQTVTKTPAYKHFDICSHCLLTFAAIFFGSSRMEAVFPRIRPIYGTAVEVRDRRVFVYFCRG